MTSSERTPRRAGFWLRILSGAIDTLFAGLLALPLARTLGEWFAARADLMLDIGSPDTIWRGPIPMVIGILGEYVFVLPLALLLVLIPEVFFGAGPGKWVLGLRVVPSDHAAPPGMSIGPAAGLVRWLVKMAGVLALTAALVLGSGAAAFVAIGVNASVLTGFLVTIFPSSDALHDRLAGTTVVR